MLDNKPVWVPDPHEGYLLAKLIDIGTDQVTAQTITGPNKVRNWI